jgi:hypothetical protein
MSTEWEHYPHQAAEAAGCKAWKREAAMGTVYYVTRGDGPPQKDCGGFYRLSTALWVADVMEEL